MAQVKNLNENELVQNIIDDMLSNRWNLCETTLEKYKNVSPNLNFCNVIFSMMKATLLLKDEQLKRAGEEIEECQKMCKDDGLIISTVKSFMSLVFTPIQNTDLLNERLLKDIITADCKFYNAILIILKKENAASLIVGLLEIRRAWSLYSSLHKKLFTSYKNLEPRADLIYGSDSNKLPYIIQDNEDDDEFTDANESFSSEKNEFYSKNSLETLGLETIKSLLAAVSFGYGIMQLCFSFLPNRLLKIVRILGFQGDRNEALKAIYFTSQSSDMRASLADILLLGYSIIGPQIFGKSEIEMYLDAKEISKLLEKNLKKNPTSAIFLFFKSKFHKLVLRESEEAMKYVLLAHKYSSQIPEFQTLTFFEMGFLHLMNLDYSKSLEMIEKFTKDSKWSLSFNVYMKVLLRGCLGDSKEHLKNEISNSLKITCRRNFIEKFSKNRLTYLNQLDVITEDVYELLIIETLFFWLFIPYCTKSSLKQFLEILSTKNEKQYRSVRHILEGSIYMTLNEDTLGIELLKKSIEVNNTEQQASISRYTQPYAHCQLCTYYIDSNCLEQALVHLNMAKSFTQFEFRSRLQAQLRSIERRLNYKMFKETEQDTYL